MDSRSPSIDMNICYRQPMVQCLRVTPEDVAVLGVLERRGLLREWDGDAKVVIITSLERDRGIHGSRSVSSQNMSLNRAIEGLTWQAKKLTQRIKNLPSGMRVVTLSKLNKS